MEEEATEIIDNAKGIVFADMASRNIDRIMAFYNAAKANKRKLLLDVKSAHLMNALRESKMVDLPNVMKDKNIAIYFRAMKKCTYDEMEYNPWERSYMQNMVTSDWVRKNQKNVVMAFNMLRLFELVDIKPKPGSDYIYSMSEHFLEGGDNIEALTVRKNWMEHFKFKMPSKNYAEIEHEDGTKEPVPIHKLHASGHMPKADIMNMIKTINPDILIPIHTQNPKTFCQFHKKVVLPEIGKTIKL